jgi:hypothetical protein
VGHTEEKCWKKKRAKASKSKTKEAVEIVMVAVDEIPDPLMLNKEVEGSLVSNHLNFIVDSGSTSHMGFSTVGMVDLQDWKVEITVGNSETMMSSKKGSYKGLVIQQDGSSFNVTLKDVLYVPELWVNFLSVTKAISAKRVQLSNKGDLIALNFGNDTLLFDKELYMGSGIRLGVDIVHCILTESATVTASVKTYDQMHAILAGNHALW